MGLGAFVRLHHYGKMCGGSCTVCVSRIQIKTDACSNSSLLSSNNVDGREGNVGRKRQGEKQHGVGKGEVGEGGEAASPC